MCEQAISGNSLTGEVWTGDHGSKNSEKGSAYLSQESRLLLLIILRSLTF